MAFQDWKITRSQSYEHGFTVDYRVPPSETEENWNELLEVKSMPNCHEEEALEKFFSTEKEFLKKESHKYKFEISKKSPQEIVFSFSYQTDDGYLAGVTRMFLSDHGYYAVTHRKKMLKERDQQETVQLKKLLEKIKLIY